MFSILLLAAAGFFAGIMNAVAGGGSFLTFPALVFTGLPPIAANATSTVAVFPGYISAATGFIAEIRAFDRRVLALFCALSAIGGVAGGILLLVTPAAMFSGIVPWLLLVATLLFAFDARLRRLMVSETGIGPKTRFVSTLAVTTYGGYFNGGLGIILYGLFASLGIRDVNLMAGLKSVMSSILSLTSVITFAIAGIVHWNAAVVVMVMTIVGGYVGARIVRRMPVKVFRFFVIAIGLTMSAVFFLR